MRRIYITRHGQTEWNVEKRMQGQKDSALTENGLMRAAVLGAYLRDMGVSTIISSPLPRALRTSNIISKEAKISNIVADDRLMEINMGAFEGLTFSKAKEIYPEEMRLFMERPSEFRAPDGESVNEVVKRVMPLLTSVVDGSFEGVGSEENVLLVTHAVALRSLMAQMERVDIDLYWKENGFFLPCSLTVFEIGEGSIPELIIKNDISYAALDSGSRI